MSTPRPADRAARSRDDDGFTLIELVISMVLGSLIAGVIAAALITALSVAKSTTDQVGDSSDTGLISAYLLRDAASSGGIDPASAQPNPVLGVFADTTIHNWGGCTQSGAFVVQFSWLDASTTDNAKAVVVTYALVPNPLDAANPLQLVRRTCQGSSQVDMVLGRHVTSAVVTCQNVTQKDTACAARPTAVSLAVSGTSVSVSTSGTRVPYATKLTASLRSVPSRLLITGPTLPAAPAIPSLPALQVNVTAQTRMVAIGTAAPSWSWVTPPPGLLLDPSTGAITGIPTASGPYSTVVTVTDATRATWNVTLTGNVTAALAISGPATLPVGQSGVGYPSTQMTQVGGTAPYTWTQTGLPTGLTTSVDDKGLVSISGTPTVSGTFTVAVTVADAMSGAATKPYTLDITAALAVSSPATLPAGEVGVGYPSTTFASTGGTSPYAWTVTGLPAGVTFNSTTLTTSGTPTTAGTFTVVAKVNDAVTSATKSYTVTIAPVLVAAWPTLPSGQVGVAYPATGMSASGGTLPYTWTVTALPTGLTMNAAGAVSGTPTAAGTYATQVTLVDAMGATATNTYSVVIAAAPVICPGTVAGWRGEYYGNVALTAPTALCRDDATIDFNWASGSPDPVLPVDNFSVRWTRTQTFAAGYYSFTVGSDDGSRLYIDGVLLTGASNWTAKSYSTKTDSLFVADGSHTIVMEFYEATGDARATLTWVAVNPPACAVAAAGWLGQYFSNSTLTGLPAACRDDADPLNFNWGNGAPIAGMPPDNFSVRWNKSPTFAAGTYQFALGADDGGRLYIDDVLVLDDWTPPQSYPAPQPTVVKALTAGPHKLVVEYYESGGFAQATLAVTQASPPAAPTLAFSAFANTFWSGTGSIVYYRPGATSGAFTATASATDTTYGITSYTFPALGTNWTSTPTAGAPGVNTYSWTGAPAAPATPAVTATNGAGLTSTGTPFTPTIDSTAPSAGSVTYPDGTTPNMAVGVGFTTGTDAGSGIATRLLQRASATLTGNTCGTYGSFATLSNGTNPTSPVADTVVPGNCYKYQYVVADNVGNVTTTVGASVVKARKP